jgi:hypothetical protein
VPLDSFSDTYYSTIRFIMAKQVCKYVIITMLVFTGGILGAQPQAADLVFLPGWQLYHAEGEVTITQGGVRTAYRAGTEKPQEILLMPQDMIQTSKGTAEIQLISGMASPQKTYTIVKMGENTSILIDKSANKEITLELLYGRVRLVTGTADPAIVFRSGTSVTTLQNCDTALDYISRLGVTQPVLSLHCFYGQGEVIPRFMPGTETAKFPVKANETVSVEYRVPYSYVERRILDAQILAYWQLNPFTTGAPLPIPQVELAAVAEKLKTEPGSSTGATPGGAPAGTQGREQVAGSAGSQAGDPAGGNDIAKKNDLPKVKRSHKINVAGLITGLIFVSGGAALQAYTCFGSPDPAFKKPLFFSGFGPEGLGTLFIIGSIFNPTDKSTETDKSAEQTPLND